MRWQGTDADSDTLQLWVADMDLASSPKIAEAIAKRIAHPVIGYDEPCRAAGEALIAYTKKYHGIDIEAEWIVWMPGVVPSLHVAAATIEHLAPGPIACSLPIYKPFRDTLERYGSGFQRLGLQTADGRLVPDFDHDFSQTAGIFVCNPHNPGGAALTRREQQYLADKLQGTDCVVVSDEIHAPLMIEPDAHHTSWLSVEPEHPSILLISPSKLANTAGIAASAAVIPDTRLRKAFEYQLFGRTSKVNALAWDPMIASMSVIDDWTEQLLAHLRAQYQRVKDWAQQHDSVHLPRHQATYLAWMKIDHPEPLQLFARHGVCLSPGADFGAPGWVRINYGTSRENLETALERMTRALATSNTGAG